MKIRDIKILLRFGTQKALLVVMLSAFVVNSGCEMMSVLGTPSAFEKKIPPQYDLQAQQDRKILLWVECPRSSDVDYDVQEKLIATFQIYLTERAEILPENVVLHQPASKEGFAQDPMKIAQALGTGYVLLVQVDDYEMVPLNVRNYYSGQMLSHAVLLDTDLGMSVWPRTAKAKVVHVGVDLETKGACGCIKPIGFGDGSLHHALSLPL